MKNLLFTTIILIFTASVSFSQVETDTTTKTNPPTEKVKKEKKPMNEQYSLKKVYFGGSIGLTFGSYFRIAIYPMIAYKFTPKLSAGVEVGYEYISDNRYASTYQTSNYGGSVIARYRVIPQLYFHLEPAFYNYEVGNNTNDPSREWIPFIFVGAGYSQRIGRGTYAFAQVKFDALQDNDSPYSSWAPFWNVGVSVGF